MTTTKTPPPPTAATAERPTAPPLPDVFEEESGRQSMPMVLAAGQAPIAVPVRMADQILRMLMVEPPEKVLSIVTTRQRFLEQVQAAAIKSTTAQDWTIFKDKEGHEVAVLRSGGAVKIRKWMGISVVNHRPIVNGVAQPQIETIDVPEVAWNQEAGKKTPTGKTLQARVAEMWADGRCNMTGEEVSDVYIGLRTTDGFVGRGHDQDLKASCRTSLDAKVVRILSGLTKVDVAMLVAASLDPAKCYLGSGHGSAEERGSKRVAEEGVADRQKKLSDAIMRAVGGSAADAAGLLKDITFWQKGDKTGYAREVSQLTMGWQIDKAEEALKKHPIFGEAARKA